MAKVHVHTGSSNAYSFQPIYLAYGHQKWFMCQGHTEVGCVHGAPSDAADDAST